MPAAVAPLRIAPYDTRPEMLEELTATQVGLEDAEMDMSSQAESAVQRHGQPGTGWDVEEEVVEEEKGWLEDDDIEDFD